MSDLLVATWGYPLTQYKMAIQEVSRIVQNIILILNQIQIVGTSPETLWIVIGILYVWFCSSSQLRLEDYTTDLSLYHLGAKAQGK